jgi:hypothetical protein
LGIDFFVRIKEGGICMPYSLKKQTEKSINNFIQKIEPIVDKAVTLTAEQITQDLVNTFDKCINDFYMYKTTSYYRHETGRGTCDGINLYRANQFRVNYSGGAAKSIHFGWNGNDMASYRKLSKSGRISTDYVLDSVMNGIRFNGDGSEYYPEMTWHLSSPIDTNYFGIINASTPDDVFEQMLKKMNKVQRELAGRNFRILYNTKKKK